MRPLISCLGLVMTLLVVDVVMRDATGQRALAQSSAPSLLQVEGALASDDETMSGDGSFVDRHTFEGEAGQAIAISLESVAFDTYLLLLDAEGNAIAPLDETLRGLDWELEKEGDLVLELI